MTFKKIVAIAGIFFVILMMGPAACKHDQHDSIMYTCPMHPSYTSDRPGKCPICGMDLVPMEHGKAEKDKTGAAITMDGAKQQMIGLKTASVTTGPAVSSIRASGRVAFDPDLVVAQREYLSARKTGDKGLTAASAKRLKLMGMDEKQIGELAKKGKPDEGLVLPAKKAWVYASIYERELSLVKTGQTASVELPDGTPLGEGVIRSIDSVLDPSTRTVRARIEIDNSDNKLKPNMFVTANLSNDLGKKLLVPKSAVITTGEKVIAFVVTDGVKFTQQEVKLGPELKDSYIVESGLSEGDVVATSALFLLDSESQIRNPAGSGHEQHQ